MKSACAGNRQVALICFQYKVPSKNHYVSSRLAMQIHHKIARLALRAFSLMIDS